LSIKASNKHSASKNKGIKIDQLIKIYKQKKIEVVALRGLSCEFLPGNISVIMGPSGCGKTTLLNSLGGLDKPSSGKIFVNGENICEYSDKEIEEYRRKKIGFVFQFINLIPELTAYDNIKLPMIATGMSRAIIKDKIEELLDLIGLENRKKHRPGELSGGEQQKIALATALANDPDILLCDEPTGELDTDSKLMIMDVFKDMIQRYPNKVIIIVSHDLDLRRIADRLYYIKDGIISHEMNRKEIENELSSTASVESQQKVKNSENELRELRHIIDEKLKKLGGNEN
jgi:putative ABC transport system ATP-binding protein